LVAKGNTRDEKGSANSSLSLLHIKERLAAAFPLSFEIKMRAPRRRTREEVETFHIKFMSDKRNKLTF
jgi:hypothetical protein